MNTNKNKEQFKVCQNCCKENLLNTEECNCGSLKFAPGYVKKICKINRQFSVQVTNVADEFKEEGKPDQRVTLYKWWPGNRSTLHINRKEEWDKIKDIIDKKLAPFIGWKDRKEIIESIEDNKNYKKSAKALSENYPEFVNELISRIDFSKVKEIDLPQVSNAIYSLVGALQNADESFVVAIKKLIEQLPQQGKRAIEDLSELLKQWSLRQVTAISAEIKHRIETIEIFSKAISDNKTYEIRGDGSIHRILENAMWIIDERYWLLHSNESLRSVIGNELAKKYKKFEKKRSDFVCGTIDNKMIIVEIKRPSHELTTSDLEQIETYMMIIEKSSGVKYTFEGYLVGNQISVDLKGRLKFRSNQIKVKTYSDLIGDVKKRYTDFYKFLNTYE